MDDESTSTSNNSLLNQLQNKLRKGALKPTTTKTTFPDGSVQYSSAQGLSNEPPNQSSSSPETSFGFVVDTKPDLSIGQVLPWLFVSSQDVPGDKHILIENGITYILSLLPGFTLPTETKNIIANHLVLEVYDEECFSLESGNIISSAFDFISDGKRNNGRVLVHCNAGLSRAPSLTIAYLIKRENFGLKEAWEKVKEVRPQMRPNAGFVRQLNKMDKNGINSQTSSHETK